MKPQPSNPGRRAIVVGASSGIGAATARHLAKAGWRVALLARRADKLAAVEAKIRERHGDEAAFAREHDATDFEAVPGLFDEIVEDLGGLDLLVYAAGTMPEVADDEYDFAKDREMVETNLLGLVAWGNEAADYFTRMGAGAIVGIGSIAGDRGRAARPVYNASKGAQAIYLEALRNRLALKGVRVVTIKPGFVATAMTAGMGNLLWMISADEAGRQVARAATRARGEVYVPGRWRLVSLAIRHIPSFLFRRMGL